MSIPLVDLARRLRDEKVEARYRRLYDLVLSDRLPGFRKIHGRWQSDAPIEDIADAVRAA